MRTDLGLILAIVAVAILALVFWRGSERQDPEPVCPGPHCPTPPPWMPKPKPREEDGKLWPIDPSRARFPVLDGVAARGSQVRAQAISGLLAIASPPAKSAKKGRSIEDWPDAPDFPDWPDRPDRPIRPSGAKVGKRRTPDNGEIMLDFPESQHLRNKGGSDGAGLCVFTSCEHSANWQSIKPLLGFRDWMTRYPGGGYPAKLDDMIRRKCAEQGKPVPEYVQMEGYDPEALRRIVAAGLMPGITYYRSPTGRYGGQKIYHMVSLVHADSRWFGVLDNNYPQSVEYMSEAEFKRCHTDGGVGWTVFFLRQSPPPVPGPNKRSES